jgi:hypothetical protein
MTAFAGKIELVESVDSEESSSDRFPGYQRGDIEAEGNTIGGPFIDRQSRRPFPP